MHIKPKTTINTQMYKDAAQGKQLMWDKEVLQKTTEDYHDLWMYSITMYYTHLQRPLPPVY